RPAGVTHLYFTSPLPERERHKRRKAPRDERTIKFQHCVRAGLSREFGRMGAVDGRSAAARKCAEVLRLVVGGAHRQKEPASRQPDHLRALPRARETARSAAVLEISDRPAQQKRYYRLRWADRMPGAARC